MDGRTTLHKLEVFRLVVEEGGVTRAAEKLFVAQPVVTAHIRSLEQQIGTQLFYREGRHLHLTEAGTAAYSWAEDVLSRTQELGHYIESLSDGANGSIALAASNSIGSYRLPPVISDFGVRRPRAHVQMNIWDTEHAVEAAHARKVDFAVVVAAAALQSAGLSTERVGEEEIALVTAPNRDIADTLTVDQMAELPFIETPAGLTRRSLVDSELERLGITDRHVVMELGHPEAMKWAVKAGIGVSLLFCSAVAGELARGELRRLHVANRRFAVPVFFVHRKGKLFSALHLELIDAIRAAFLDGAAG